MNCLVFFQQILDERQYSVLQTLAGKQVPLVVDGPARELVIWSRREAGKRVPITGFQETVLPWAAYVAQPARRRARSGPHPCKPDWSGNGPVQIL
jgi:hypothetical protein